MEQAWIKFDIPKLRLLKEHYENAIETIKEQLPEINLNSRKELLNFFEKDLNIHLQTSRIKDIERCLDGYTHDQEEYYILLGVTYYFKLKYALKNYVNWVLKNESNGIIYLRLWWGEWSLSNRQPLPKSPEILACVIGHSNNIILEGVDNGSK